LVLRWQPMMRMMTAMKEQGNLVKNKKFFFFVNNNSWHRKFGDVEIQLLKKKQENEQRVRLVVGEQTTYWTLVKKRQIEGRRQSAVIGWKKGLPNERCVNQWN
jgi:hypothetical protein